MDKLQPEKPPLDSELRIRGDKKDRLKIYGDNYARAVRALQAMMQSDPSQAEDISFGLVRQLQPVLSILNADVAPYRKNGQRAQMATATAAVAAQNCVWSIFNNPIDEALSVMVFDGIDWQGIVNATLSVQTGDTALTVNTTPVLEEEEGQPQDARCLFRSGTTATPPGGASQRVIQLLPPTAANGLFSLDTSIVVFPGDCLICVENTVNTAGYFGWRYRRVNMGTKRFAA